jgi:lipoate-protein ligase A
MILIERTNTNPYFNIAAEEYILKNYTDDVFMLWVNDPAIILGKHQNAIAEINIPWVREHHVPVIRRISGGGTVFHDHGNLNFTFIKNGENGKLVDFESFTKPIIDILNKLGVEAKFEGKNDLRVNGLKISGNAEHVFKNRVLHHGTLLFNSQLDRLNEAIRVKTGAFQDKAVKSNRSVVSNIKDFLPEKYWDMSIGDFRQYIVEELQNAMEIETIKLSEYDIEQINSMVNTKYKTWEWNYGYSPLYSFRFDYADAGQHYSFEAKVKNGLFKELIEINGVEDSISTSIQDSLINIPHRYDACINALQGVTELNVNEIESLLNV